MKRWWSSFVKDYLTFTKKERIAIFLLLAIAIGIYFVPDLLKGKPQVVDKTAFTKELAQLKITIDSSSTHQYKNYKNDDDNENNYYQPKHYASYEKPAKGELFAFDPNTLDEDGWKRLGIREKTILTIQKFTGKGYKFRQPEDIKKIYGLHEDEAERLIPYIHIKETESSNEGEKVATSSPVTFTKKPEIKTTIIDINAADTAAFISLPGIGNKLASRIITFRERLGGFTSVQQLAETYGVADSTFQKIRSLLVCDHPTVKTIDINTADANQLKTHPYIRWNIANAIIAYRQQHGNYKSLDELKKIDIITEEAYTKILPYLKVL